MNKIKKNEQRVESLKALLTKLEKCQTDEFAQHIEALKQTIEMQESFEKQHRPMGSYYSLEDWLYSQTDKSVEIKSAIAWGGLSVVKRMGCISWNEMREMYGEFMSKHMGVR